VFLRNAIQGWGGGENERREPTGRGGGRTFQKKSEKGVGGPPPTMGKKTRVQNKIRSLIQWKVGDAFDLNGPNPPTKPPPTLLKGSNFPVKC